MPSIADQLARTRIFAEELTAFCVEAMLKAGMREEDARTTAEVLVTTDTWGIFTHGSKQLQPLLKMTEDRVDVRAVPEVVAEGPAWAIIDGHYALAMVPAVKAMQLAIDKAKKSGIAFVGVRNSNHFGACAYYANMAVKHDLIGVSMTNVNPLVTVPGGKTAIIGTNPFAYAVPAGKEPPIFLDIATSIVAASKVISARAVGKPVPEGWIVDADGLPTTDASGYPDLGVLLPMAGHKGYGIALLIEILSAVLTDSQILDEVKIWLSPDPGPLSQGHAFLAINPGLLLPIDRFKARIDEVIRKIKTAPKAKGADRIYLPGEMEWERRAIALKEGMLLPADVIQRHELLAQDYGLDLGKFVKR